MKVKLVKVVEGKDCTRDFLENNEMENACKYSIVKFNDEHYAVVNKEYLEAQIEFKEKRKIYEDTWILTLLDNSQCILKFTADFITVSLPFLRTIRTFKDYVLIEKSKGVRKLIKKTDISTLYDWIPNDGFNHAVLQLANSKYSILRRNDLEVANVEFDVVSKYTFENSVIINIDGRVSIVRVSDFKTTPFYREVLPFVPFRNQSYMQNYVIVIHNNGKKAIMCLNDLRLTPSCDDIIPLTIGYALMISGNEEVIMRISDFKAAKFD